MLMDKDPGRNRPLSALMIVLLALTTVLPAAGREPIPTDSNGLPQWVERTWNDFPVSLDLADAAEVARLLAAVPIASFEREQLRPDPTTGRLVFEPRVTAEEAAALGAAGYDFTRLPDREQEGRRAVEAFWAEQAAKGLTAPDPAKALSYPTHAQIGTDLAALAAAHPTLARTFTMGTSVQGRSMWGIVISDDVQATEAEPEVRLTSSIHGDETVGMVMLWNLAHYLLDNYGQPGFEALTDLVDNTEIHIVPLHNPDGYVAGGRYNANGVDLNRNFPEPAGTHGTIEVENLNFMAYAASHHFVISQNTHGGALVVNYPWDYTYTRAPDDAALIPLSLAFSTTNLPMYNSPVFSQGITNGADWYVATGTLQDWSYDQTDCIDVTIEISNTKWPVASALDGYWEDNRQSLLNYVAAAHEGVNGVVTGADSGLPLAATVTVVGNSKSVSTDPAHGDYYKLLPTGTWQLFFSAPGYLDKVVSGVATTWGTPTVLNVQLDPVTEGDLAGTVTAAGGAALDAVVAVYALPLDQYVTSVAAPGGVYATTLPYGDYRLEASATGHATVARQVTIGPSPVTANFVLGAVENVELFASDFEADMAGWSGGWGLSSGGVGHESSGSLTDSPGVNYADNVTNIVTMATGVSLDSMLTAQVSFWAFWSIEPEWDACFCEVSVNGGQSWTALGTSHTAPALGQGAQTPAGAPCFDGSQAAWVQNTASLDAYVAQADVRIRFRLASDTNVNAAGFTLDDFRITATRPQDLSPVPGAGLEALRIAAWPNPFNPSTTVAFTVPRSGLVELRIYDLRGRMVRTLESGHLEAGTHRRTWDGHDAAGSPVGSGVYFAQARVGTERAVTKLMLVK